MPTFRTISRGYAAEMAPTVRIATAREGVVPRHDMVTGCPSGRVPCIVRQ